MFDSPWLDRLSRVHPIVPVVLFGPAITAFLWLSLRQTNVLNTLALGAAGYVLWTLFEYWLHRLVFHFEPVDGLGARLHWIIHGVHHDHPNDPLRLVMPPAVSVPLAVIFALMFDATLGARFAPGAAAGFFAGYLIYDTTHYFVHHRATQGRLARVLRERHMRHHFQDDTRCFGVSAPYWDNVFGTAPQRRAGGRRPQG
jgi:sterol desaturase/sphingolipid hydroxylase (fatty acid hydroxylase superfamily)